LANLILLTQRALIFIGHQTGKSARLRRAYEETSHTEGVRRKEEIAAVIRINCFRILFALIALTAVTRIGLFGDLTSHASDLSKVHTGVDTESTMNDGPAAAAKPLEAESPDAQAVPGGKGLSRGLVGTWVKEEARQEGQGYAGDEEWRLSVTFRDDGRFVWHSRRRVNSAESVDESLRGTYEIEGGFLVTYLFEAPSKTAEERLPELFAYWPKQLLGQHTFKRRGDTLVLGHDGAKLWIHLQRESVPAQKGTTTDHAPLCDASVDGMMEAIHADIMKLRDEYPWLNSYVDDRLYEVGGYKRIEYMPAEPPGPLPKVPDQMEIRILPFDAYRPYRRQRGGPTVWRIGKMGLVVRAGFTIREPYGPELEEKVLQIVGRRCVELRLLLDER